MTKVSICCSVKNQSKWLREMIASVVAQTFTDWEMVLVDDGSAEDIKAVVQEFNDSRIRFFRFDENRGIPHGINFAFENATGEYVKPMAADETLWPQALEVQAKYLDENKAIAACFGLPRHGELGLRPEYEQYALDAQNRSRAQWLDTFLNLRNVPLGGCNGLWRRSLHAELGYFDPTLTAFSDHEWYCRLVQAHDIRVLPYRVATYRDDPQSVSNSNTDAMRQLNQVRAKHLREHEPKDGLITVGIPVKNMPQYVLDAIKSVQAQTYPSWELLIVDDGSTDNTYDVVREHMKASADDRIRLIKFPENRGDREACNYMLAEARGEYFTALSADDTIEPTYMQRVLEIMEADPLLDFCSTQTDFINEAGDPFTEPHPFKDIEKAANKSHDEWKARLRFGNVYFGVGTYRTQALRDAGGWVQKYGVLSDYAMYLEMLTRGNIHVIEEPLTHTRITGKNMSTSFDPLWLRQCYAEIKKRFYPPRRKLIIATPFYSVSGFSPYIYALVHTVKALTQAGVDFEYWHPSGDAYVQRVKNTIFSKFIEDLEATDLLMIDSDMEWEISALLRMLMLPEELIVGSYPQKNAWELWTSKPLFQQNESGQLVATQKTMPDGGVLIEGEDLAGGFMLVKRGILERYMQAHPDLRYIDESADPAAPTRIYTEFFAAGPIADGNPTGIKRFWGEDRSFSRRLKAMGERWWIYANITFGHWGMKGWAGNLGEYLAKRRTAPANDAVAPQRTGTG
jgi:glycosyltransferase involved in cell wall biosynthesis